MNINNKYEEKYEKIIRSKLLNLCMNKKCQIFLFGSRAQESIHKGSDFDIGIQGLSKKEFNSIDFKFKDFLEESIVPYDVDLINFENVNSEFKEKALEKIIIWKTD